MRQKSLAMWGIVLACVVSGSTAIYALATNTSLQRSPAPDIKIAPIPPMTETKDQHKARIEAEGRLVNLSGPATMGTTITIANKSVKLPADAYVESYVLRIDCAASPCPETPAFVIKRGNSTTWVSQRTGTQSRANLAPGRHDDFAFLKEALGR